MKAITELLSTWKAANAIEARLEKNIEEAQLIKGTTLKMRSRNSQTLIDKRNRYFDTFKTWALVLKN